MNASTRPAIARARVARATEWTLLCALVAACSTPAADTAISANGLIVRGAFAPEPLAAGDSASATMSAYFVVENTRDADTLDAIATPVAAHATVHAEVQHGGMVMMMPAVGLEIPAHGTIRLRPGARHVMLEGLSSVPRAGDRVPLVLHFRHAGVVRLAVPVIRYVSIDSAVEADAR
jgi:copper(I)-binding protein